MNKKVFVTSLFLLVFLFLILINPYIILTGSSKGLKIWLYHIIPSLFPCIFISNFLIQSNYITELICYTKKNPTIKAIAFLMFWGFSFGMPMGAKMSWDLYQKHIISKEIAIICSCFCNHLSPAFIGGYVITQHLNQSHLLLTSYFCIYLPSFFIAFILILIYIKKNSYKTITSNISKKEASRFTLSFEIVDASIKSSFILLIKLGGYIMLFSILCQLVLDSTIINKEILTYLLCIVEITTGVSCLMNENVYLPLLLGLLSFGGLCGMMQSISILSSYPIKKHVYIISKFIQGIITFLLSSIILY